MALDPYKSIRRKLILQEVYEENLRINEDPVPSTGQAWRVYVRGVGLLVILVVVGAILVLGGGLAYQKLAAQEPTRTVPAGFARVTTTAEAVYGSNLENAVEASALNEDGAALLPEVPPARYTVLANPGLSLAELFDLQIKTIVIDPGHGGKDPGAIGHDGLLEKEVTLDVALRLKRRLEQGYGATILLTREDDKAISLRERVEFANEQGADLFISLHLNSLPVEPVTAIETFYFGPQTDKNSLRLAELENKDSDYSMADFNDMLQRIGDNMKKQESQGLARSVQTRLIQNARQLNHQVSNWGVKTAPFVVLLGVEAPSILAEMSVISNREEETKLNTKAYREKLALFLEEGIVDYLDQRSKQEKNKGVTEYATEEE